MGRALFHGDVIESEKRKNCILNERWEVYRFLQIIHGMIQQKSQIHVIELVQASSVI